MIKVVITGIFTEEKEGEGEGKKGRWMKRYHVYPSHFFFLRLCVDLNEYLSSEQACWALIWDKN